jgi:hypothetical protein
VYGKTDCQLGDFKLLRGLVLRIRGFFALEFCLDGEFFGVW